jgi:hypothetical protein
MSLDGEATVEEAADEVCASCDNSAVDDKAQEELKKRDDACEDYSNDIVIENDTSPPPPEEHDIVVEAFAVPEEDIVVTAAEQGENTNNNNNGEQQQDDEEAVVQHPPQPEPSSSDNVPVAQGPPTTCGIDIERLKRMMTIGSFITFAVGIIMIIIGGVSKNDTILSIGIYIFIIFFVGWFLALLCRGLRCVVSFAVFRIQMARMDFGEDS